MLVAEARYLGTVIAVMAAFFVSVSGSVAIARTAHLPDWVAFALCLAMLGGIAYAALWFWLRSLRDRSDVMSSVAAEAPARFAPFIVSIAIFILQVYWIATSWSAFESSHSQHDADLFGLACIMAALNTFVAVREWRSKGAIARGTAQPSPFEQTRLAQFTAALEEPTKAARAAALRPLRIRGNFRFGLIAFEVALMLVLAPRVGVSLALVGSFTIVAGIFLIGHKYFDL